MDQKCNPVNTELFWHSQCLRFNLKPWEKLHVITEFACNPCTWEVKVWGSEIHSHPQLHSNFKSKLLNIPCLNKGNNIIYIFWKLIGIHSRSLYNSEVCLPLPHPVMQLLRFEPFVSKKLEYGWKCIVMPS